MRFSYLNMRREIIKQLGMISVLIKECVSSAFEGNADAAFDQTFGESAGALK